MCSSDLHDFGKGGDYEGVETLGNRAFVLRSDGDVYHIEDWTDRKSVV